MNTIIVKTEWLASCAGSPEQRRATAESLCGEIDWLDATEGYCACPGIESHSNHNGRRDCRVRVDETPNFYCFHQSCLGAREITARRLLDALAALWNGTAPSQPPPETLARIQARQQRAAEEQALVDKARAFWSVLQSEWAWSEATVARETLTLEPVGPRQAGQLVQLFQLNDVVWIGERTDSGQPRHAANFRKASEWLAQSNPPTDNFTCPSTFQAGTLSRSNDAVSERRFLVLESDTLTRPEVLAVFNWARGFMRLRAVVDTAGKSTHAWFESPDDDILGELKIILPAWGFDPALFKASQPCRMPGTIRKDKDGQPWQRLLFVDGRRCGDGLQAYRLPSLAMVSKTISKSVTYSTIQDIWQADFPAQKWAVEGIIPVGLTILAGRPKIGKSYLTLGVALSIAAGDDALGVRVEKQGVLMLALEDTSRRIQKRLRQMRATIPEGKLLIRTTTDGWPRLDAGGEKMLDDFLTEHAGTIGVVMIDTLQKVKPMGRGHQNAYENDYSSIGGLHSLAAKHCVAIVLVHHTRKTQAEDVFDEISGSLGLTGVADTNIVIRKARGSEDAVMHVTGRDVEERELAMRFDDKTGLWTLCGDADLHQGNKNRQIIVKLLTTSGDTMTLKELQEVLESHRITMTKGALKGLLWRMVEDGEISKPRVNAYGPPNKIISSSASSPLETGVSRTSVTSEPANRCNHEPAEDSVSGSLVKCEPATNRSCEPVYPVDNLLVTQNGSPVTLVRQAAQDRPQTPSGIPNTIVGHVSDISVDSSSANPPEPPPPPVGLSGGWEQQITVFDGMVWRWKPAMEVAEEAP